MSKKQSKKKTDSKNTYDIKNRISEKKSRYYAFGYLVSDY